MSNLNIVIILSLQEKALFLTGGLAVFDDFILAAGCDTSEDTENLFIFHQDDQLDLGSVEKVLTSRTLTMNSRQNHLITFDATCLITIYGLHVINNSKGGRSELDLQKIAEIRINELLPHPTCVVSIQLTSLNYYEGEQFCFFCFYIVQTPPNSVSEWTPCWSTSRVICCC